MKADTKEHTKEETIAKVGFCALCRSRCGATFSVMNGRLVMAGANPDHPTGSALCVKGKAAPEILYSPERILHPMRRTTPKSNPDPKWEKITWEEALTEVAEKLSSIKLESGAEAVGFSITSPSGSPISDNIDWIERFIRNFGSPNTAYATELCNWHKDHAHAFTFGSGILYPEYKNSDTILLWGFNPSAVWLDQATQVAKARARGATIIAVDPRDAGYARDADHWLRVLPGNDGVLALGIANILIQRNAYNSDFIRQWSNAPFLVREDNGKFLRANVIIGYNDERYVVARSSGHTAVLHKEMDCQDDSLLDTQLFGEIDVETIEGTVKCRPAFDHYAKACADYPIERVSKETGIPAKAIEAAAEALIDARNVAYYCWTGVGQHANATQTDRAIAMLMALKGCYDTPGGNVAYTKHTTNPPTGFFQFPDGQLEKTIGRKRRPLGPPKQGWITADDLYGAILEKEPYAVRGLMVFGANLAVSHPETRRAQQALRSLEFHVHCDSIETPTARFADIFLPINTMWEREGLRIGFEVSQSAEELIQLRQPIVERQGESRSDTEIVFNLACKMGMSEAFYGGDIDAAYQEVLKPTGVTLEDLRAHPEGISKPLAYRPKKYTEKVDGKIRGFNTDTGRVEIYSELFLNYGYPPVPKFATKVEDLDEFPLILTTAKNGYYMHSAQRHIPSLRKRSPEPIVEVSHTYAEANAMQAGDKMRVITEYGEVQMKLQINKSLHPRVVVASYGWWQGNPELNQPAFDPFSKDGANYNRLISARYSDPVSGAPPMRSTRCRLELHDSVVRTKPAWKGFVSANVISTESLADGVQKISLRPNNIGVLPDYLPGQHITLKVEIGDEGTNVTRCYSLIGTAINPHRDCYELAVRHVPAPVDRDDLPAGKMSGHINQKMSIGDEVLLKAPSGRFVFPIASKDPIVLIAGGIGITPFMSYLETVAQLTEHPRIHLVYANRNSKTHAFRNQLRSLQKLIRTLTITNIYDAPLKNDQVGIEYDKSGFVTIEDLLLEEFQTSPLIYQCGPPPMMDSVEHALIDACHPMDRLHREAFVSPISTRPIPQGPFRVAFARSGKELEWTPSSGSLLDLGESAGLALASGCRAGQCESCTQKIISGTTEYRTEIEHTEDDQCLICQAVPSSDLVLDA